jgi:hypothetical protein
LKLSACHQGDAAAATLGALKGTAVGLEIRLAIPAVETGLDAFKVKLGAFGDGAAADNVPVELDRVVDYAGQITDNQVELGNPPGVIGVAEGYFQNALGDGQFVHGVLSLLSGIRQAILPNPAGCG